MIESIIPLEKIVPYNNNPRDIRDAVEAVKESIRRYGFHVPIILDKQNVIIAGHTRYQALLELGHTEASCIVSDMPEDRAREFRLVDNRSSEIAGWDKDRLVAELRAIEGDMAPFFRGEELKTLMGQLDQAGETHNPTPADVAAAQQEQQSHFQTLNQNMNNRTRFVHCEKCGKKFGFDTDIKGYGYDPHEQSKQNPAG